jgi:hypothetical protein
MLPDNPTAREISLQASRAEMPNYDWAEIARKWFDVEGDPKAEQVYLNDWWGLPLRERVGIPALGGYPQPRQRRRRGRQRGCRRAGL